MTRVVVTVVGGKRLAAKLRMWGARAVAMAPAFDRMGDFFRNQRSAQYAGGGWVPNAPSTVEWKGFQRPLVWKGGLKASWTVKGSKGNINRVGAQSGAFGSRYRNYGKGLAALHQFGTPVHVPARPMDLLNPAFEQEIVNAVVDHIFGR